VSKDQTSLGLCEVSASSPETGPPRFAPRTAALKWAPDSWTRKLAQQQPVYPDPREVDHVVGQIACLPPLVTSWEVRSLKSQLAEAARGQCFLLQGGDCAESFDLCDAPTIVNKIKILLQMSLVMAHGSGVPVVRVGRFAGQYAKPRSENFETRNGVTLPCYRGDMVNRLPFTPEDRTPNPELMLRGYKCSALTLNFIRALVNSEFSASSHSEYWDLNPVRHLPAVEEYYSIAASLPDTFFNRAEFFSSHEALLLPYEQAQTRRVPHNDGWYNLSTHLPWIGVRTSDPDGAHVEYCKGIANPIGIKVGPAMTTERLQRLLAILDPSDEPGRITLIHRFGCEHIERQLPPLIEAVRQTGKTVLWCCDPMHGNTQVTRDGIKTRHFEDIVLEVSQAMDIHADLGSRLGGIHIELTGDDVTECVGGPQGLTEADLKLDYRSLVDPRLNYEQSLELALFLARKMRRARHPRVMVLRRRP
jgi:3-deoxy-7-phosphoheptulonate synthase